MLQVVFSTLAVKYAYCMVCVLAADQSTKTGSYSKCWPGSFCTGPVMGMRTLTSAGRILPWYYIFKHNWTSEVCSPLPFNSNQAETWPSWTWAHSTRLKTVALVGWMSSSTGKENVKSQPEEQSWREQEKVMVRDRNKVWREALQGTEK